MNEYEIKLIGELLGAGVPVFYGEDEVLRLSEKRAICRVNTYLLKEMVANHITYIALTRCRLDEKAIPVKKKPRP